MPYQLGESPINGGDGWIRANDLLRMKQLHYHCATSPHMASREGFEPPPTVLETGMLPLHYRDIFGSHGQFRNVDPRLIKTMLFL
jgi:hypothetical protein